MAITMAITGTCLGKDKSKSFYPVALIDSAMRKDAWAVCRDFRQEFVLHDNGKAIEHVHLVITVLEKRGDNLAELEIPYDKSSKITSISGRNYDAYGLYDEKLKSGAIQDVNYTSEGAIYDDLRMKSAKIDTNTYPYTVEYEYDIEYNGLLGYPTWRPLNDYHLSVEKSSFVFSYPENMSIRYREKNLPGMCRSEKTEKGKRTLEWKIGALQALREEPFSPQLSQEMPIVITAPVGFDYCGTTGSMNTWNEFGRWINQLLENRDQMPSFRQKEIQDLVKGLKDTAQIVRTLYEYMQKRTHYVGIQLGIGGFQPFPAETVDNLGYGDCKALSNYMKALLKAVGIESNYTIVGAASSKGITMEDFPTANQCNHAILCVPQKKDTIWLECTNQTVPCGYMSKFTAGRRGLVINSKGSRIVTIPMLTAQQSTQCRKATVSISAEGVLEAKVVTNYIGYQYDNISGILTESKNEQEKALYENLSVTGMKVSDFTYQENKLRIPEAIESIVFTSQTCAARSGSRIFVPVNIFNQVKFIPTRMDNRKMPVYREFGFLDTDSVTFQLPNGYKPESVPRGKTLKTPFGEYCSTLNVKDDKVLYTRMFKMNPGFWPKEEYAALVDFYTAVVGADKVKLVIRAESQ
jgi:hypothetical protein